MDGKLMSELKELFPGQAGMFKAVERGDIGLLCRYVFDNCQRGIDCDEILRAQSLEELKEKASKMKQQWELYKRISSDKT